LYCASFDLQPFRLEYLKLEKFIWCKLIFFGFLTQRPIFLPNFSRKWSSYEKDMIFLRELINFSSRQVLGRNKSNLLKYRLSTLKRNIFIFFWRIQMNWRDVRIRVSYQIKRKRERKRGSDQKDKKTPPFSPIPEIIFSSILFISFLIDMQG